MAVVAVVDDSRLARAFAASALRSAGHEVVEVEPLSLEQTLAALLEHRPAVLVLDLQMPAFPGTSLVRACVEEAALADLKVLILTAQRDDQMEHRMEKLGVHGVLHKPVSPAELAAAVARLLPA